MFASCPVAAASEIIKVQYTEFLAGTLSSPLPSEEWLRQLSAAIFAKNHSDERPRTSKEKYLTAETYAIEFIEAHGIYFRGRQYVRLRIIIIVIIIVIIIIVVIIFVVVVIIILIVIIRPLCLRHPANVISAAVTLQEFSGPVPSIDQFEAGAYALAQPECGNAGRDVRECLVLPRPPEVDPRVAMEMNFTEFPPEVGVITAVIFCVVPVAEQRAGWDADRESVTG
jgi:hypothetical protein